MKTSVSDTTLSSVIRAIQSSAWSEYDRVDLMMQAISQWQSANKAVQEFGIKPRRVSGEMCLSFILEGKKLDTKDETTDEKR